MRFARPLLRGLALLALIALAVTGVARTSSAGAADPYATTIAPGLDLSLHDPTCTPCDDFYQFATGGFAKKYPIPAAYPAWSTFSILAQDNAEVLHQILASAAADTAAPAGSNEQKIGGYYASCMNVDRIEAAGLAPLKPQLDAIAAVTDVPLLVRTMGALKLLDVDIGWTIGSEIDNRDSSSTIASAQVSGLGLPDRDYYLEDSDRAKAIRAAYVPYVTSVLTGAGIDEAGAARDATAILALETTLARATPSRADLRDPNRTWHPQTLADLQKLTPAIDWRAYLAAAGAPSFTTVNVALPEVYTTLDGLLTSTPLAVWKAYADFQLINTLATALPKRFDEAHFALYGTTLQGTKEQLPRYRRCVRATDGALGEALGAVYVAKVFPPAAKARALALVDNLQSVLADDIRSLDWMSPATKARAEVKLAAYAKKIGYPDHPRDYSSVTIDGSAPFVTNTEATTRFAMRRELERIGKPTDRTRFGMTAPTVDAYYSPSNNEIVFPAGILRPPFFSNDNDDAVNYGAIGEVIGHEMTHGFDDQGRQFDERGNQVDWWTSDDAQRFTARAQCTVDQFNALDVQPGVHENGKLVEGEALADLGGATIAYKAFEKTAEFKAGKRIDGYTPQQRFFLAFAQVLAGTRRPEYQRYAVKTDPHPDAKFRVNATLDNMPAFRQAWGCKASDAMVHVPSCGVW